MQIDYHNATKRPGPDADIPGLYDNPQNEKEMMERHCQDLGQKIRDLEERNDNLLKKLERAMSLVAAWERPMALRMLEGLTATEGVRVFGISDPSRIAERCPTIACRIGKLTPLETARRLGEQGIFVWDGNYYAISVTERLGLEATGGMVRIGIVHYNTPAEVERLLGAVEQLASSA